MAPPGQGGRDWEGDTDQVVYGGRGGAEPGLQAQEEGGVVA